MNKDYWELTDKERAGLTREQVEGFIAYELMSRGVGRVPVPTYEDVPEADISNRVEVFQVKNGYNTFAAFEDRQQATDMLVLLMETASGEIRSEYDLPDNISRFEPFTGDWKIEVVETMPAQEVNELREELKRKKQIIGDNAQKRKEYTDATKEVENALEDLWTNWSELQEKVRRIDSIKAAYDEYMDMCDHDQDIALNFLRKAKGDTGIEECSEWLELGWKLDPEAALQEAALQEAPPEDAPTEDENHIF